MDFVCKEHLRNPYEWEHRDDKVRPVLQICASTSGSANRSFVTTEQPQHKPVEDSVWVNSSSSLSPIQRKRANPRASQINVEKQIQHKAPQGEDSLLANNCNRQEFREDTGWLVSSLKACAKQNNLCKGTKLHTELRKRGLLGKNIYVGTALVNMYAKCGALAEAQEVFNELPVRDVVSWSALIAGYAQEGRGHEALKCFECMQLEGLSPNAVTFACILKACGSLGAAEKGEEIHAEIVRQRLLEKNTILGTALVDMYAKCGALVKAKEVFDSISVRDVVSWNALIAGYSQHGHGHEALNCFQRMQHEDLSPNAFTIASVLKACGSIGVAEKGEEIHAEVVRQGLLGKDSILGTALLDMYAKCGVLAKAQEVFDELSIHDVVSWSALIAGYAEHGHGHEALTCFDQMQHEGLSPDAVTFACILKACGSVGAAEKGGEIHAEVVRHKLLEKHTIIGNALVDMYAKCGILEKAQEVFDELPVHNVVSWSALIAGYAQLGKVEIVHNLLNKMLREGIEPDLITFTVLLNACSHAGLVDEGEMLFANMSASYGILPTLEHCTCMVDLFARAGHFKKAIRVIDKLATLDFAQYYPLWAALLGACRKWSNVTLGRFVYEHLIHLDGKNAAAYVCMRNIYAVANLPEEADEGEATSVGNKAWDVTGYWWTEMAAD